MKMFFAGFLMILFLSTCERERIDEHQDFIGVWYGFDIESRQYHVEIASDGYCYFLRKGSDPIERDGPFWISEDEERVKIAGKRFDLITYPVKGEPKRWNMQIDDIILLSDRE